MSPETPDRDAPSDDLRAMMVGAATLLRSAMRAVPNAAKLVDGESATPSLWLDVPPEVVRDLEPEEAMLEVCARLLERLLSRETDSNVEARQAAVMDRLGRLAVPALAPNLPDLEPRQVAVMNDLGRLMVPGLAPMLPAADTEVLDALKEVRSEAASDAAIKLIKADRRWLLHPLVVVQVDRWRMAHVVRKRAGYLPERFAALRQARDTEADRFETLGELLVTPIARAKGDKVNVDAFQEVYRQVQMEIARVRGVFEAWVASGEAGPPERVRPRQAARVIRERLRNPTWLSESTLLMICESPDHFPDEGCIRVELLEQYDGCRAKLSDRTIRSWVAKYIEAEYRPIPERWIPQIRSQPLAKHFKPQQALPIATGSGRKKS